MSMPFSFPSIENPKSLNEKKNKHYFGQNQQERRRSMRSIVRTRRKANTSRKQERMISYPKKQPCSCYLVLSISTLLHVTRYILVFVSLWYIITSQHGINFVSSNIGIGLYHNDTTTIIDSPIAVRKRIEECNVTTIPATAPTSSHINDNTVDKRENRLRNNNNTLIIPNLHIIGAQKAGTTAIAEWIFRNDRLFCKPSVRTECLSDIGCPKEVQFFDQHNRYRKGVSHYAESFRHCSSMPSAPSFVVDATANTLIFPERLGKFYKDLGGNYLQTLKLIVILREPVSRELSLYNHKVRLFAQERNKRGWYADVINKKENSIMSFDDYIHNVWLKKVNHEINTDDKRWSSMGMYAHHLKKWFQIIDRKRQLLILSYDELKQNATRVESRIRDFLEVSSIDGRIQNENSATKEQMTIDQVPCSVRSEMDAIFDNENQALYRLLKYNLGPPSEEYPFRNFNKMNCT